MENRNISDSQITASSEYDNNHAAHNGRLHYKDRQTHPLSAGSWCSRGVDLSDFWLQVDFATKTTVVKVATQGRFEFSQWVKSYSLSYSHNGGQFEVYKQFGEVKVRYRRCTTSVRSVFFGSVHRLATKNETNIRQYGSNKLV